MAILRMLSGAFRAMQLGGDRAIQQFGRLIYDRYPLLASYLLNDHPRTLSLFRAFLGNLRLSALVAIFVVALFALSGVFSVAYWICSGFSEGPSHWFLHSLLMFTTVGSLVRGDEYGTFFVVVHSAAAVVSLLVPALFLGAVLAKLLVAGQTLVFREKLSAFQHKIRGPVLALHFYNGSQVSIANVKCQAIAHIDSERDGAPLFINTVLRQASSGEFALAMPYVPLSAFIALDQTDLDWDCVGRLVRLRSIQGIPLDQINLLVFEMRGFTADLHSEFVDVRVYKTHDDIELGKYPEVEMAYHSLDIDSKGRLESNFRQIREWDGFMNFDAPAESQESSAHMVFGYGSIADTTSLEDLFENGLPVASRALLRGYTRVWNAGSENLDRGLSEKHYIDPYTNAQPSFVITSLNIEKGTEGDSVSGVLIEVGSEQLDALDAREWNYHRIDVTNLVDHPADSRVWAYTATSESVAIFEKGKLEQRARIRRGYKERVEVAFEKLGITGRELYGDTKVPEDVPVVELELINPTSR